MFSLWRIVATSGLKVRGMERRPRAKMTISSGQVSTPKCLGSMSLVTKGAAVTLSRTYPSRPRRVRRELGDICILAKLNVLQKLNSPKTFFFLKTLKTFFDLQFNIIYRLLLQTLSILSQFWILKVSLIRI